MIETVTKPKIHGKFIDSPELITLSGSLGVIIAHFTAAATVSEEVLTAAITAAIYQGVQLAVRLAIKIYQKLRGNPSAAATIVFMSSLLPVIAAATVVMLVATIGTVSTGCGMTYHLETGGWVLEKSEEEGVCLTVSGDGDPEVSRICIKKPEPLMIERSVLEEVLGPQ